MMKAEHLEPFDSVSVCASVCVCVVGVVVPLPSSTVLSQGGLHIHARLM